VGAQSFLYKVPKSNPANWTRLEMDFPCDDTTIITDRKPAGTGWRWVWTRDQGAVALDKDFKIVTSPALEAVRNLVVAPDGSAFVYDPTHFDVYTPLGTRKWYLVIGDPQGNIISLILSDPFVRPDGKVLIPLYEDGLETTRIYVGIVNADGTGFQRFQIEDSIPLEQRPPVAFDPTGTVMYMAKQGATSANVQACAIGKTELCKPSTGHRLWISEALPGYMAALVVYDGGKRLAAIGSNRFWFLEARDGQTTEGQVMNKDQLPLTANGALVARFAQPGPGSAFYMFTSGVATDQKPYPLPVEIVATDAAEKGELFRYQVPGGSLYGALDDTEALWLRVGTKMVKPFTPQQYRELR
jgi:hypothetical protein